MEPPRKTMKLEKFKQIHQQQPQPCSSSSIKSKNTIIDEINESDLPLLANSFEVVVRHYLMKLKTNFTRKVVSGTCLLYLEWLDKQNPPSIKQTEVVLDACFIKVKNAFTLRNKIKVPEIFHEFDKMGSRKNFYKTFQEDCWLTTDSNLGSQLEIGEKLNFLVDKWSITISGWDEANPPSLIGIEYETELNSPSLDWRPCSGFEYKPKNLENVCAYTPASPVNNRGLFPCQEPPEAASTWEIILEVEKDLTPLLTSDEPGEILKEREKTNLYYFYTSIPMPLATFSMVIGHFHLKTHLEVPDNLKDIDNHLDKVEDVRVKCEGHPIYPCRYGSSKERQQRLLPVRLFSLDLPCVSIINHVKLSKLVYNTLNNFYNLFGTYPFSRLDLVIMPFCYPHMGLSSPGMVFLSPSNFVGGDKNSNQNEEPLYVCRIVHEISHYWFGLSLGALIWTEEWLSEGFATFCEDFLMRETFEIYFPYKSKQFIEKERVLKICTRFMILEDEQKTLMNSCEDELRVLSSCQNKSDQVAKNGLVPIKQFMHTHYYKGYLLLWHLATLVGQDEFMRFLKEYVNHYHGQLVNSNMFLQYFHSRFHKELSVNENFTSINQIKTDWLRSDKLPAPYSDLRLFNSMTDVELSDDIPLFSKANACLKNVKQLFHTIYEELRTDQVVSNRLVNASPTEVLILLELLIKKMGREGDYGDGDQIYMILSHSPIFDLYKNPEIFHRWCELIILNKDESRIHLVEQFLQRHMAMGIYLYGELIISEDEELQDMARRVHRKLKNLYDLGSKRLLKDMLF